MVSGPYICDVFVFYKASRPLRSSWTDLLSVHSTFLLLTLRAGSRNKWGLLNLSVESGYLFCCFYSGFYCLLNAVCMTLYCFYIKSFQWFVASINHIKFPCFLLSFKCNFNVLFFIYSHASVKYFDLPCQGQIMVCIFTETLSLKWL